ncbi:hypothetical protein FO440_19570 [Mucilaginibacter corticis]|uniref:Uncharacterized protein n=1 Tax=Mucilaginibacter corticis TaxID=2597670 RepID=A0A556MFK6_9SPHI|nr:hypothetical protein [Mucilaginibacter corticis]TSJ38706.1 hypothetical protein FO440_19570 [Mucilaginibacter corticis]
MKRIWLTVILLPLMQCVRAGDLDSLISIKGYYITKISKADIVNYYKQKLREQKGKSFFVMTDIEHTSFFLPVQIEGKVLLNADNLKDQIKHHNDFNKDTLFYMPLSKRSEEYIKYLSKKEIDLSKVISLFNQFPGKGFYFTIKSHNDYLYKCVYLEAYAQYFEVENNSINRLKIDADIDAVNRNAAKINLYLITKVAKYNVDVKPKGLNVWNKFKN